MSKTHPETFGARLARLMRLRGLDNETLARMAGVNASQISAFRGNLRYPRDHNQKKLAKALGITRDQLTGDAELMVEEDAPKETTIRTRNGVGAPALSPPSVEISAAVQEATYACLADIAHAILEALTARTEAATRGQVTGTRVSAPRRAAGN